jgi:4-amino-4-deoxy-L-arabinose transferase-like glycosyltransferase
MVFDERPSPARVSAAAAAKLPRAVLLALIAAYIVSGLFGRDPWPEDDATGFGVMWTMAHGGDWLLPAVAGEPVAGNGPLAYWAGAASIAVFGGAMGDIAASRLPAIAWFFLATGALWYATLRLARREEAQPVAFAFGGEATSRDYGRMLADVAVLLLLATVGPIIALHETTAEPAAFALGCVVLYGLVLSIDRPEAGGACTGVALGLVVLAQGLQPAVWILAAALALVAATSAPQARLRAAAIVIAAAVAVAAAWVGAVLSLHGDAGRSYLTLWWVIGQHGFGVAGAETIGWLARNVSWFTFPLWPLALWALYAWRHGLRRPHIAMALVLLAALAIGLLGTRTPGAEDLLPLIAPLLILASFGAVALRRAADNVIDWFAITAYCLLLAAAFAYFFAMHAGMPPKMATSVLRLTAGHVPPLDWARVAVAAAATALWLALVAWRLRRTSVAMWRGPALAAAGMVTLWTVFSSLFLGAVDHRRSFAAVALAVADEITRSGRPGDCVLPHYLRPSHLAVFAYHGGLRFASGDGGDCAFALHRDVAGSLLDDGEPPGRWTRIWEGHRPGAPQEAIRLYRRAID